MNACRSRMAAIVARRVVPKAMKATPATRTVVARAPAVGGVAAIPMQPWHQSLQLSPGAKAKSEVHLAVQLKGDHRNYKYKHRKRSKFTSKGGRICSACFE